MGTQTDEESETSESESDTENKSSNNTRRKRPIDPKKNRKEKQVKDQSFWKNMLGTFFDANSWINSIEGRAAKVHSFMRGLSLYQVYPFSPFTSINEEQAGNSNY